MIKIKCPYCDKIVEGYTKEQTGYMLKQHILSKHKDKVNFSKVDKEDTDPNKKNWEHLFE